MFGGQTCPTQTPPKEREHPEPVTSACPPLADALPKTA